MKKKISLLLCLLLSVMCFAGCAQKEAVEYDEESIEQVTEFMIEYCSNTEGAMLEEWKGLTEFALEYQLMQAGLPLTPESFLGAIDSWQAGLDECGEYISHGDYSYEMKTDSLEVSLPVEYSEREATILFVFDENLYLESMTVNAQYSLPEILEKAGLNTVLGMGTVFVVLIFISLIISLFKYIPAIQNAFKNKKTKKAVEAPVEKAEAEVPVVETVTDDYELIAVIAAAIAAAEGTSTDGLVVRSIRRRPSNKWKA